jgi:hypothetical protein
MTAEEQTRMAELEPVDHRKLVEYFVACIEAENRARGSFQLDRSILQFPRGLEPAYGTWMGIPTTPASEEWLRDRRLAAERETINLGWPLVTTGGRDAAVAPLFVAEAELDASDKKLRASTASLSVSPAALRAAGFDAAEIDSLLLSFDGHDDLSVAGLQNWMTHIGLDDSSDGIIQSTPVAFVGEDTSQITYFLVNDLEATGRLSASDLRTTALGALLSDATAGKIPWDPTPAVLNTNLAQERACQLALAHQLTLVTGPPGTGKSQVLVNTAIAAVCRGEKVLIASRNNHAIEVVLDRLQAIDPAVVVPRVGAKSLRGETAAAILRALDRAPANVDVDGGRSRWEAVAEQLRGPFGVLRERAELTIQIEDLNAKIDRLAATLPEELRAWTPDEDLELIRSSFAASKAAQAEATSAPNRWFWQRRTARRLRGSAVTATLKTTALMGPVAAATLDDLVSDRLEAAFEAVATTLSVEGHRRALRDLRTQLELLPPDDDVEDLVNAVADRQQTAIERLTTGMLHARRPASPSAAGARRFAESLANVAAQGKGVRALPSRFPDALSAFPLWVTTSQSASSLLPMKAGLFDLVIVDESGQADFASAMPLLARGKRAMIVGDPRQLQHITQISARAEEYQANKAGVPDLVQSQFNYIANSLYGVVANRLDAAPTLLHDHYRSHADIIGISNRAFYGDQLRIRTPAPTIPLTPVEWLDVSGTFERGPGGRSAKNLQEAHESVRIAEQLAADGLSVGIVSPFRAQIDAIRKLVSANHGDEIAVDTAHGFQGDERDAIVFSLVVNKDASDFLWAHAGNDNLVNVAITRARSVLRIVGDKRASLDSKTILNDFARSI